MAHALPANLQFGLLGPGYITDSGVCVVFRPDMSGYRISINHRWVPSLPFGGHIASIEEGVRTVKQFLEHSSSSIMHTCPVVSLSAFKRRAASTEARCSR